MVGSRRGCCVSESFITRAREGRDAARRFWAKQDCLLEGRGADSAYTHRPAPFILDINTRWDDGDSERHIEWTRAFWEAMRPFSAGGVYVNFLGQEGEGRVLEAFGPEKFERLVAVKRTYDPTFFRINRNIPPA